MNSDLEEKGVKRRSKRISKRYLILNTLLLVFKSKDLTQLSFMRCQPHSVKMDQYITVTVGSTALPKSSRGLNF